MTLVLVGVTALHILATRKPYWDNNWDLLSLNVSNKSHKICSLLQFTSSHKRKARETKEETGLMLTSCTVGWDIKNLCSHFCSLSRLNSIIENSLSNILN